MARDASSRTESKNDVQKKSKCSQISGRKLVVVIARLIDFVSGKLRITYLSKISKYSFKVESESLVVFSVASLWL
jgi:hypothetical protein